MMEPWAGGRVEVLIVGVDLHVTVTDRDANIAAVVLSPDEGDDLADIIESALTAD